MQRSPGTVSPEIKDTACSHPLSSCITTPSSGQIINHGRDEFSEDNIGTQIGMIMAEGGDDDQEMIMKTGSGMIMNVGDGMISAIGNDDDMTGLGDDTVRISA